MCFFREIEKGKDLEYVVIEVWLEDGHLVIMNFYEFQSQRL